MIAINEKYFLALRYFIIAGIVYLMDMGGYVLLLKLNVVPVAANVISKVVATFFGFFGHRGFTYGIKDNKNIVAHAIKFFGIFTLYIPISSLALVVAIYLIGNEVLAKFICDILLFLLTFWVNSKFTFLQSNLSSPEQAK